MKRCREYWLYYLSFVLLSSLIVFHSNKVLAQSSPGSNDDLSLIPSDELIDDDIEIIEEMINQQQKVEEPDEIETKSPTNGNNDNDDSGSMAAVVVDNDNEIENDRNTDGQSFPPEDKDKDKDIVTTKRDKPITGDDKKVASQNNPTDSGVYVVD